MKTTLDYFCQALGWETGTLEMAKQRFAVEDMRTMDYICGVLVSNMRDISDLENVQYFTRKRLEAAGLHVRGLNG